MNGRPGARQVGSCAICDGTNETTRLCEACRADPINQDWVEQSDLEQGTDDADVAMAVAGSGERFATYFGGRRKADTPLADLVVQIARSALVPRRRRRRTANGWVTRGWETVMVPPNEREIAEMAGCSQAYVHKLLKRLLG